MEITHEEIREKLKGFTSHDLFNELWWRDDVVAVKMWTRDDLVSQAQVTLKHEYAEHPELEKSVDDIVDMAMENDYDCLRDCTNDEWNHVESCIRGAIDRFIKENDNA